jgi:pyruvate,water dikinase
VGGKNASLGEMIRELSAEGVRVPGGFATTAAAYRLFIRSGDLQPQLHRLLDGLDGRDIASLQAAGAGARALLLNSPLPAELEQAILTAYRAIGSPAVAVRSSATAEDLPDASFAGQQETYLNVNGEADLLAACRRCYASLFTDRAISYRQINGFDRRAAHGALRPGLLGGDVQHRHRDRLPQRRAAHRRLRPGRERGAGGREPR